MPSWAFHCGPLCFPRRHVVLFGRELTLAPFAGFLIGVTPAGLALVKREPGRAVASLAAAGLNGLGLIALGAMSLTPISTPHPQSGGELTVKLETDGGGWRNPASVTLRGDDPGATGLVEAVVGANFFSLKSNYPSGDGPLGSFLAPVCPDAPTYIIAVTIGSESKRVRHHDCGKQSVPERLTTLERPLFRLAAVTPSTRMSAK
jgi:hypothetical protein